MMYAILAVSACPSASPSDLNSRAKAACACSPVHSPLWALCRVRMDGGLPPARLAWPAVRVLRQTPPSSVAHHGPCLPISSPCERSAGEISPKQHRRHIQAHPHAPLVRMHAHAATHAHTARAARDSSNEPRCGQSVRPSSGTAPPHPPAARDFDWRARCAPPWLAAIPRDLRVFSKCRYSPRARSAWQAPWSRSRPRCSRSPSATEHRQRKCSCAP